MTEVEIPDSLPFRLTPSAASALMDGTATVVPVEPTDEMMNAGLYQASHDATWADVFSSYRDQIAASPYRIDNNGND